MVSRPPRIGVLALQGAVEEHLEALRRAGAEAVRVRGREELASVDGLIVPGGESTVIAMLLDRYDLREPLAERLAGGMPAYGTCAGLILMAREVEEGRFPGLDCLDVTVRRNAFGRQVESFECDLEIPAVGAAPFRGVFIRAPLVVRTGEDVEVLAEIPAGPVLVRQGRHLGGAFHPELTDDLRLHELFVRMVAE